MAQVIDMRGWPLKEVRELLGAPLDHHDDAVRAPEPRPPAGCRGDPGEFQHNVSAYACRDGASARDCPLELAPR